MIKTSYSTGFIWRENNKFMKMKTFVGKATKWPVSYISRPLVRMYGRGQHVTDGKFIKRPSMRRYHMLALFDPMTVCGMPDDSRKAFDMLERDVLEGPLPESNLLDGDVLTENASEEGVSEEDHSDEDSDEDP